MRVVILGAGGHGKVLADILSLQPAFEIAGFTDPDEARHGTSYMGYPVLGTDEVVSRLASDGPTGVIIGVGNLRLRRRLIDSLEEVPVTWINALHPSSIISESAELGCGVAVMPGAVINCLTTVSDHAIVNTNASIDHDCVIGENVHVAPGVAIGGSCRIGDGAMIGIGARLIPGVTVGAGSIVGAGAAVVGDVPEMSLAAGVPARVVKELDE